MTDLDSARAILSEARANIRTAAKAPRRSPGWRETVAAPALPRLPAPQVKAMPTATPQPMPMVNVDLTGLNFTAKMLAVHTGVDVREIRRAIHAKKIRTTRQDKAWLLNAADAARWLWQAHSITPMALTDIAIQEF